MGLPDAGPFDRLRVPELRQELAKRGLDCRGTRRELLLRLVDEHEHEQDSSVDQSHQHTITDGDSHRGKAPQMPEEAAKTQTVVLPQAVPHRAITPEAAAQDEPASAPSAPSTVSPLQPQSPPLEKAAPPKSPVSSQSHPASTAAPKPQPEAPSKPVVDLCKAEKKEAPPRPAARKSSPPLPGGHVMKSHPLVTEASGAVAAGPLSQPGEPTPSAGSTEQPQAAADPNGSRKEHLKRLLEKVRNEKIRSRPEKETTDGEETKLVAPAPSGLASTHTGQKQLADAVVRALRPLPAAAKGVASSDQPQQPPTPRTSSSPEPPKSRQEPAHVPSPTSELPLPSVPASAETSADTPEVETAVAELEVDAAGVKESVHEGGEAADESQNEQAEFDPYMQTEEPPRSASVAIDVLDSDDEAAANEQAAATTEATSLPPPPSVPSIDRTEQLRMLLATSKAGLGMSYSELLQRLQQCQARSEPEAGDARCLAEAVPADPSEAPGDLGQAQTLNPSYTSAAAPLALLRVYCSEDRWVGCRDGFILFEDDGVEYPVDTPTPLRAGQQEDSPPLSLGSLWLLAALRGRPRTQVPAPLLETLGENVVVEHSPGLLEYLLGRCDRCDLLPEEALETATAPRPELHPRLLSGGRTDRPSQQLSCEGMRMALTSVSEGGGASGSKRTREQNPLAVAAAGVVAAAAAAAAAATNAKPLPQPPARASAHMDERLERLRRNIARDRARPRHERAANRHFRRRGYPKWLARRGAVGHQPPGPPTGYGYGGSLGAQVATTSSQDAEASASLVRVQAAEAERAVVRAELALRRELAEEGLLEGLVRQCDEQLERCRVQLLEWLGESRRRRLDFEEAVVALAAGQDLEDPAERAAKRQRLLWGDLVVTPQLPEANGWASSPASVQASVQPSVQAQAS